MPVEGQPDVYKCVYNNDFGYCSRSQYWMPGQCVTNEEPTQTNCYSGNVQLEVTSYIGSCAYPLSFEGACTCTTQANNTSQEWVSDCLTDQRGCS